MIKYSKSAMVIYYINFWNQTSSCSFFLFSFVVKNRFKSCSKISKQYSVAKFLSLL